MTDDILTAINKQLGKIEVFQRPVLSIKEAAVVANTSRVNIETAVVQKKLPTYSLGGLRRQTAKGRPTVQIRILRNELMKWVESQRIKR